MIEKDPIIQVENILKETHIKAKKYTSPVLNRYPLLFSFLTIFSVAAILHGFEMFISQFMFIQRYPLVLIAVGVTCLLFTGALYKTLDKMK